MNCRKGPKKETLRYPSSGSRAKYALPLASSRLIGKRKTSIPDQYAAIFLKRIVGGYLFQTPFKSMIESGNFIPFPQVSIDLEVFHRGNIFSGIPHTPEMSIDSKPRIIFFIPALFPLAKTAVYDASPARVNRWHTDDCRRQGTC